MEAGADAEFPAGTLGFSAGGVTFAECEVTGSSGRTGSVESFGFAAAASEFSPDVAGVVAALPVEGTLEAPGEVPVEDPAEAAADSAVFFCVVFAGLAAAEAVLGEEPFEREAAGPEVPGAGLEAAGVVGMIEAILSFSTSTKPKSVLILNMLSSYATITP